MKRRQVIKNLSVLPVAGVALGSVSIAGCKVKEDPAPKRDFFKELGVVPRINAGGTMTYLSGSLMLPEVIEAINSTCHDFANMYELQDKAGEKIAAMLKCEAAMVTSGAAAALVVGTAACITGTDRDLIKSMPTPPGPQREVIIQKSHRYVFDQAVRSAGIKLVDVDDAAQMERSINKNTVMALFFNGAESWGAPPDKIKHEEFVAICKKHNIPSFIDAAADVPPVENLFKYQQIGFDLVTFSGGKMLMGPQSAGLLFGRKDLIEAAKLNYSPHECPIGRPMKVNKEEIFGMYAALKYYLEKDHEKEWQMWLDRIKHIAGKVEEIPTVKTETSIPTGPANVFPSMRISWDAEKIKITAQDISKALLDGTPSIIAGGRGNSLGIGVVLLRPEQVDIVATRVKEILQQAVS
ncbi:MAG: aminotransferase class V-fold PLP-dependent enzyme [Bacteroidales bacterium]|jgi:L-seryl-tRNA(Ser) seleniumtransferase|nr:aminotransferase class V-fold PLP-dependent enzyme [Bacteroidales bacterium]